MSDIRDATSADEPFLWHMLGYASGGGDVERSEDELRNDPAVVRYLRGWGRPGDVGVVAISDDQPSTPLGSAWFRLFPSSDPGYGFVDEATPELSIACLPAARGHGVGRALLEALLDRARAHGFRQLSLSTQICNARAVDLYLTAGFEVAGSAGSSLTMIAPTDPELRRRVIVEPATTGNLADRALGDSAWGDTVVSRGQVHTLAELPGFVATLADRPEEPAGLATYRVDGDEAELVSLESRVERRGVGTALLRAVRQAARDAGCRRVWLVTTNDNVDALRFYQRRGWDLVALHPLAVESSRELKPSIPRRGDHGIAIRHELELEWRFDGDGGPS